jgi:hypothetical protein
MTEKRVAGLESAVTAAGEHRRHPPSLHGEACVSHGIYPLMDTMKAAGFDAPSDRISGEI